MTPAEIAQADSDFAQSWLDEQGDDLGLLMFDAIDVGTACEEGCSVELDGTCPHGHQSPLRVLGLI